MKTLLSALTVGLVLASGLSLSAQNRDSYGIWVRDDDVNLSEFAYKGLEYSGKWSEIEAKRGVYNWKNFDAAINESAKKGLNLFISVNVGPDSPKWLFENGSERVMTEGHRHVGPYPEYKKAIYFENYHRLIEEFGRHVRSLPKELTDRISFVQVKTGATGDESPYKGDLLNKKFNISNNDWSNFRLAAFKKYQTAFQEGLGPVIPLMFTSLINDDNENKPLLDWVSSSVKLAWGTKMGGTGQGYQINGETWRTDDIVKHTIDPEPGLYHLFTRCEMDQGWKEGIYAKNISQAFYWTSISAVHSGLTMWNITGSARLWHVKNNYWRDFIFFNKYAGQTIAAEATSAFSALREGLDSSDKVKFPESEFGPASIKNTKRYIAICASRAAYGARMDDPKGVTAGMMVQRREQDGLNDSGWEIFPGNLERFLHQINPDQTSVGWWRVGGEITQDSPDYARFARGFEYKSGKNVMSFDIKDSFFSGAPLAGKSAIKVRIVYYDKGTGQWALNYDAVDNPNKTALTVTKQNSGEWKEAFVTLTDANFGNRGLNKADLALVNTDKEDDIFHMIEIDRVK